VQRLLDIARLAEIRDGFVEVAVQARDFAVEQRQSSLRHLGV